MNGRRHTTGSWSGEQTTRLWNEIAAAFVTLRTYGASKDDLQAVQRIFSDAFAADAPEDVIGAAKEWRLSKQDFPAPGDLRPLIDERVKRRLDWAPKIAHNRAKESPVNYTFDERLRFAERIHDGMADIFGLSGRKMPAPRDKWIVAWMRQSVTKDCYMRRITNAAAAGFHAQIDALAARLGVASAPEVCQTEINKHLCGGFNAA